MILSCTNLEIFLETVAKVVNFTVSDSYTGF